MATSAGPYRTDETPPSSGRSLGQLFADASHDLTALVHNEIALAKVELRDDAMAAAKGGAMFGAAAFLGLLASVLLSIAAAYGLAGLGLDAGWAFLIVAVVYLLIAGILALIGKRAIKKVGPPRRTIETTKESIAALKGAQS